MKSVSLVHWLRCQGHEGKSVCIYKTKTNWIHSHFYTWLKVEVRGTEAKSVLYYSTKCLQNVRSSQVAIFQAATETSKILFNVKISRKLTRWQSHYNGFQTLWKKIVEFFFLKKRKCFVYWNLIWSSTAAWGESRGPPGVHSTSPKAPPVLQDSTDHSPKPTQLHRKTWGYQLWCNTAYQFG